jgi:glutamate-1-semialdehyde 2,1-aminomutase
MSILRVGEGSDVKTLDRRRLAQLLGGERRRFVETHPRSAELFGRAKGTLLGGVPMPWMTQWAGPYPVFLAEAEGARFVDVDGNDYVDFCLGDTGAMTGHAPKAAVAAIAEQSARGITLMLPVEDSVWVGEELARRFGLPYWQFCLTATDANRFTIRLAREITGRPKILVFSWCYHGTVDETFIVLDGGRPRSRPGNVGPAVDPIVTTRVVEWNDVEALERELAHEDVACVLAEPVMTNIGIILPEPGFHDALRDVTRRHGTLLVIDETHTICAGPGGFTRVHGLQPDFVTIGKPLASGVPAAAYGMTAGVAEKLLALPSVIETSDVGGIGGTLSGNALSLAAMRATLEHVLTEEAFGSMVRLAERFEEGVQDVIDASAMPWHVVRLGCRVEYKFRPTIPRNGSEAAATEDAELDRFLHLFALNRGVLMTPFHNMALMSPATTDADVDRHTEVLGEAVSTLIVP